MATQVFVLTTVPSSNGPMKGTQGKLSNKLHERGTSPPQRAIAEFEEGQKVHFDLNPSVREGRSHPRFNGLTSEVTRRQDHAFKVQINDGGKEKTVIVHPAHLRVQR